MQTAFSRKEAEVTCDHTPGVADKERVPSSYLPELDSPCVHLALATGSEEKPQLQPAILNPPICVKPWGSS